MEGEGVTQEVNTGKDRGGDVQKIRKERGRYCEVGDGWV